MRPPFWFGTLAASLALQGLVSIPVQAVRLSDGKVYFTRPPSLVEASTTERLTNVWGATYYFTLNVPENAGEPLQRVTIAQRDGGSSNRRVLYDTQATRAFLGSRGDRGTAIPVASSTYDRDTQSLTVTFAQAIPPGSTVTLALRPQRNPQTGGTYLFGVTAFPAGEAAYGQFLGYGRFAFDEPDHFLFPFW